MIGLGGAVLLLVGGVFMLFPKIKKIWLLAIVAVILATCWAVFLREFSKPYCIFVAAVNLVTWATVTWGAVSKRPAIVAFIASVSLALFWLPVSVSLFRSTIVVGAPIADVLAANSPLIALWILIIAASVLSGFVSFRPQKV